MDLKRKSQPFQTEGWMGGKMNLVKVQSLKQRIPNYTKIHGWSKISNQRFNLRDPNGWVSKTTWQKQMQMQKSIVFAVPKWLSIRNPKAIKKPTNKNNYTNTMRKNQQRQTLKNFKDSEIKDTAYKNTFDLFYFTENVCRSMRNYSKWPSTFEK